MDTGTLIDVVIMLNSRIEYLKSLADTDVTLGRIYELQEFRNYLQEAIEANIPMDNVMTID
jgi:hypothetical protein